jgi:natural product biosynthesis luciferase-like monooxygenase protein
MIFAETASERTRRLAQVNDAVARHESFWVRRLATLEPADVPTAGAGRPAPTHVDHDHAPWSPPPHLLPLVEGLGDGWSPGEFLGAAFLLFLARCGGRGAFDVAYAAPPLRQQIAGLEAFFASHVPLRVALDPARPAVEALNAARESMVLAERRLTYARDVLVRYPQLSAQRGAGDLPLPVALEVAAAPDALDPAPGAILTFAVSPEGTATSWIGARHALSAADLSRLQGQFAVFVHGLLAEPQRPLQQLPLLSVAEGHQLLVQWNDTALPYPQDACIQHLFSAQARRTPAAIAAVSGAESITYQDLERKANRLAHHLRARGAGPDTVVAICLERTLDLPLAVLGVLKAGAAYLPLDPTYPRERLELMVADSGARLLITEEGLAARTPEALPRHQAEVVTLGAGGAFLEAYPETPPEVPAASHHLAYVIYTSGSTGKPKGVMVEHRNAVSFFTGMDERLDRAPGPQPGTWMAVTSLSFDISVLELLWTLTRGFKVVIHGGAGRHAGQAGAPAPAGAAPATGTVDFSLFYFASDEGGQDRDKYRLLLDGARFADRHGFAAVWTPERHFHAFGGLYPNPAVTGAAVAAVTERVQIRAGSVVGPLHHPARIAEEWALVDNLSGGRAGISFAAGWQPNDFVLAPDTFADRKRVMVEGMETVKRLWRGEAVSFPGPRGEPVAVRTLPRPVQPELPVWLTVAGNPESYRLAGELGAGVLTHLLGQSVEELAAKLSRYRQAWREAGHPGQGHVALMLHTFVGDDVDSVRETVRGPMKAYLRSSVDLIRAAAWSFPAFKARGGRESLSDFDPAALDPATLDALLDHAFERYFETSGLFGTPQSCLPLIERLTAIGVHEIACLVDFGVAPELAFRHLEHLARLKDLSVAGRRSEPVADDESIAALIERHGVTHLQCTPSMAGMLCADERTRLALRPLRNLLIGGEAIPASLATALLQATDGDVINMYGPTETTVWSTTYRLPREGGVGAGAGSGANPPIGRPIANTRLYVLDAAGQPVPAGVPGELFIGGAGVVRGYLNRPELTAERFVPDPFGPAGSRLYRTGDLVRYRPEGNLEYLGRLDHQVKLRGYRIELGEIESAVLQQPGVREAVVVAREDIPGDKRLVAYVVPRAGEAVDPAAIRRALKTRLPEYMVPAHVVTLEAFPLTPNAKIDRKALPAPDAVASPPPPSPRVSTVPADPAAASAAAPVAPAALPTPAEVAPLPLVSDLEGTVAAVWRAALNVGQVGLEDNFFDLGGHSLLMVQVQQQLKAALGRDLSITDLFRFPTIRSLTRYLASQAGAPAGAQAEGVSGELRQAVERAEARREMLLRRRGLRP